MDGLAPLSWGTIQAWAELTKQEPMYHEQIALMYLDAVRRDPPPEKNDG